MSTPYIPGRVATGSTAMEEAGNRSSGPLEIFHSSVEWLQPHKDKQNMKIRILPAHDMRLTAGTPEWRQSYIPYRDPQALDDKQREKFTNWFAYIRLYRYLGNSDLHFISPQTLPESEPAQYRADPVQHLRDYCRKDPALKYLTEAPKEVAQQGGANGRKQYSKALLPQPQLHAIVNVLACWQQQSTVKPYVFLTTEAGFRMMLDQLNLAMPRELGRGLPVPESMMDPQWGRYMLGDVTSPERGLMCTPTMRSIGTTAATAWALQYLNNYDGATFDGYQPWPLQHPSQLEPRADLTSWTETLRYHSYQEIVDALCMDGFLDRELIARACGHNANVPTSQGPTYQNAVTGFPAQQAGHATGAPSFAPPPAGSGFGAPPAGQFPGAPPAGQFPGAPPAGGGGFGAPPAGQFPGAPPAGQFPGAPPAGQFPGAPPAGQFPGAPPAGQFPGAPPAGGGGFGAPPAGQFPGAPPAGQFPGAPPAGGGGFGAPPAGQFPGAPPAGQFSMGLPPPQAVGGMPHGIPPATTGGAGGFGVAADPHASLPMMPGAQPSAQFPGAMPQAGHFPGAAPAGGGFAGVQTTPAYTPPAQQHMQHAQPDSFESPPPPPASHFAQPPIGAVGAQPPLSAEEMAKLQQIRANMERDPGSLSSEDISLMGVLQNRAEVNQQAYA